MGRGRVHIDVDAGPAVEGDGWSEHLTKDGRSYYHHPQRGTTWRRPPELGVATPSPARIARQFSGKITGKGGGRGGGYGASNDVVLPTEEYGSFFEHVLSCRMDAFDWVVCCSGILVIIGICLLVTALATNQGPTQSSPTMFWAGAGLAGVPIALWCLIVGLPFM